MLKVPRVICNENLICKEMTKCALNVFKNKWLLCRGRKASFVFYKELFCYETSDNRQNDKFPNFTWTF